MKTDHLSFTKAVSIFFSVAISKQLNAVPYLHGIHESFPLPREKTVLAMLTG